MLSFAYFSWWYGDALVNFWQAIGIMTEKIFSFFSIKLLLRTLVDPWKRDAFYVENASLDIRLRIWFNNLISRFIGFIMRTFTILLGLAATVLFFVLLLALLFVWVMLPIVVLFLIFNGIRVIING